MRAAAEALGGDRRTAPSWDILQGGFRPDIEGLRGVAILLVVAFHCGVPGLAGGYVGVDVFFVLSGYLITGILMSEIRKHGRISFKGFYARRVRRLLPVSGLVVATTAVVSFFVYAPFELVAFKASFFSTALYVSNLWFASHATRYFAAPVTANPLLHTWSLAAEEQFYLLWPAALLLLVVLGRRLKRERGALLAGAAVATVASFVLCVRLTAVSQPQAFFLSPTRFWEFAVGGLALAASLRTNRPRLWAWLGLGAIVFAGVSFGGQSGFPGYIAAVPVLGTVAVLVAGAADPLAGPLAALATDPMQWLGRMSYAWYLWQWPLLLLSQAAWGPLHFRVRVASAVAALVLAAVTVRLVERPVRFNPTLVRYPRRSLALGLAITVAVLAVIGAVTTAATHRAGHGDQAHFTRASALPSIYKDGCAPGELGTETPARCVYGVKEASASVALFGDSHAGHWFPAVERLANAKAMKLLPFVKNACPSATVSIASVQLGRHYSECDRWRAHSLETIKRARPSLVIVSNDTSFVTDHPHDWQVTPAQWEVGLRKTRTSRSPSGVGTAASLGGPGARSLAGRARTGWPPRSTGPRSAPRPTPWPTFLVPAPLH